jgi:hypothetical protein
VRAFLVAHTPEAQEQETASLWHRTPEPSYALPAACAHARLWPACTHLLPRSSFKGQSWQEAAWNVATRALPCLTWLSRYDAKKRLYQDVAAGVAVAFLIVPQGLSYAGIAGLPAIYGLYTDFVPLIIFFLFTSSQYLQVGAVAIVSLLTNDTVSRIVADEASRVAALKAAAASAAKALAAQRGSGALAALSASATAAYNAANVALIQKQVRARMRR